MLTFKGYLHAKVALYYPFFLHLEQMRQLAASVPEVVMAASKCTEASRVLIREVFRAYKTHILQRTWYENITTTVSCLTVLRSYYSAYIFRAFAVVLTNLTRLNGMARQTSPDRDSVVQALHVLDALDNNDATRRIANFAREYLTLLAKSGIVEPPSPLNDRYQGTPPPWGEMSNFDTHIPPPPPMSIGNWNDHLPSQSTAMPVYEGTAMNGFTMLNSHDIGQPAPFLPSSNVPFHARPT